MATETKQQTGQYLIPDYPLIVLPKLAVAIGLNEAIALQQTHYLLGKLPGKTVNGVHWVKMTDKDWIKQFPFWTRSTVRRVLANLVEEFKVLKRADNISADPLDRSSWYTIDYEAIAGLPAKKSRKKRDDCPNLGQWLNEKKKAKAESRKLRQSDAPSQDADKPVNSPLPQLRTMQSRKLRQHSDTSYSETSSSETTTLSRPSVATDALGSEIDENFKPTKELIAAQLKQATTNLSAEVPAKAVEPPTVKESIEDPNPHSARPLPPPPAGLEWYMTAGDNYLLHAAAPTPSGKQIKPVCGAPGNYATRVTANTVIGNRQPCQACQRKAAAKAAPGPGAKAPRKAQPYDGLIDAVATQLFGATDRASINAVGGRVAKIVHGAKNGETCIGLIAYECERQGRERNELDYNQLADDVEVFWGWMRREHPDIKEVKDCMKVLDYWQKWRNTEVKVSNKWMFDPMTGWRPPTNG